MEISQPMILHVDLNSFFARAEQQANTSLRNRPIGILGKGHKGARTCIVAASPEAKKYGIKSGMNVAEAQRLCPQIVLVPPNYPRYLEISRQLVEILDRVSPWVEIFSIDEAFVDLHGTPMTTGRSLSSTELLEANNIATTIKQSLRLELGELLTASIGIAWGKTFAKLASDLVKPDGLVILDPITWRDRVGQLPVGEVCGIGSQTSSALSELGVRTINDLSQTDPALITARLGRARGIRIWEFGQGIDRSLVTSHYDLTAAKSIGHQVTLDQALFTRSLWPVIVKLTTRVARRLRRNSRLAGSLSLQLLLVDGTDWHQSIRLNYAEGDRELLSAARILYDRLSQNPSRTLRVGIVSGDLTSQTNQPTLTCFTDKERDTNTTRALDKLRDQFGDEIIGWGSEHAVQLGNLRDWRGSRATLDQ